MRVGTIVSLVASAALGLGALFVARIWLPSQTAKQPVAHQAVPTAPGVPVVLASSPISYGDKIDARHLTVVQMPADAAPAGAFSSVDQVMKQDAGGAPVALVSMAAKEPILATKVSGPGARPTLAAMIADGYRAYTIGITEVAGGGGHILPGDRVDVVVSRDAGGAAEGGHGNYISEVVSQNVRVLGMDLNVDQTSSKPAIAHTATLEVTMEDAERLALAAQAGVMSLALRKAGSAEVTAVRPMQASDLSAGNRTGFAQRAIPVRRTAPRRAVVVVPSAVLIIHGANSASVAVPSETGRAGV